MKSANSPTPLAWERQPDEDSRAYRKFCMFRDFGPDRSQDKAYALHGTQRGRKLSKAPGSWSKCSIKYNWVERAEAYDDWRDEENRNEEAATRQERHVSLSKFVAKNFRERIELHQDLYSLLKKLSSTPLSKVTKTNKDATGAKIVTQLGPLNPGQVAELFDTVVRLEKHIIEDIDPKEPEEEMRQK